MRRFAVALSPFRSPAFLVLSTRRARGTVEVDTSALRHSSGPTIDERETTICTRLCLRGETGEATDPVEWRTVLQFGD